METKSVEYGGGDITSLYPFQNLGCGGCTNDKQIGCDAPYIYFAEMNTKCEGFEVSYPVTELSSKAGCTKIDTASEASEEELSNPPVYSDCTCENVGGSGCILNCEEGVRHSSDKLLYVEAKITTGQSNPCECGGLGEDACEGTPFDPRIVDSRTESSCSFQFPYFSGDEECDPSDPNCYSWATNTTTYSNSIDARTLSGNEIAIKLDQDPYPTQWKESCGSWCDSCQSDLQLITSVFATKTWNPEYVLSDNEGSITCPSIISKNAYFSKKYKVRWRFPEAYSCYVKIWICKWRYTEEDKFDGNKIYTLEDSSIIEHEVPLITPSETCNVPMGIGCSQSSHGNRRSDEYELSFGQSINFPSGDPDENNGFSYEGTRQFWKTTHEGIAIVGMSRKSGWEPPLYKFSDDVWQCRVSQGEGIDSHEVGINSTYSCPYAVFGSGDYPSIGTSISPCFPLTDEQIDDYRENFNQTKNISTCDAP
jgi:hypothetical protein